MSSDSSRDRPKKEKAKRGPLLCDSHSSCKVVDVLHARRISRAHASEDTNTSRKCIHRKHRPATSVVAARRPLPSRPLPPPCPVCTSPADALMPLMQSCTITRGHPGVTRHAHDTTEPLVLVLPWTLRPRSIRGPTHPQYTPASLTHCTVVMHGPQSPNRPRPP